MNHSPHPAFSPLVCPEWRFHQGCFTKKEGDFTSKYSWMGEFHQLIFHQGKICGNQCWNSLDFAIFRSFWWFAAIGILKYSCTLGFQPYSVPLGLPITSENYVSFSGDDWLLMDKPWFCRFARTLYFERSPP